MSRPGWDEYFLGIADAVARRSTCFRRSVGCVITDVDHRILATGYNGVAAGQPHCNVDPLIGGRPCGAYLAPTGTDLDGCDAIHAEQNALVRCADGRHAFACYTQCNPCVPCIKLLLGTPIRRVVFRDRYEKHHDRAMELWIRSSIDGFQRTWVEHV